MPEGTAEATTEEAPETTVETADTTPETTGALLGAGEALGSGEGAAAQNCTGRGGDVVVGEAGSGAISAPQNLRWRGALEIEVVGVVEVSA